MNELLSCPFCGSEAEYYGECDMVWIRCSICEAQRIFKFDEPEEAVEDWNTRAPVNEWISVADMLPDRKGHYLAISKMNWAHGGTWEDNDGDARQNMVIVYFDSIGMFNHPHITHWKPLPAPPHETTENEKEV